MTCAIIKGSIFSKQMFKSKIYFLFYASAGNGDDVWDTSKNAGSNVYTKRRNHQFKTDTTAIMEVLLIVPQRDNEVCSPNVFSI